jgi:2'-5' RNA ligase
VRLFVAIDVSGDTRAQLRLVRETLECRLGAVRKPPRVTWVAEQGAHVTLRFIGEVSEATAEKVRDALAPPIEQPTYELEFGGVGMFPNTRRPRVVWIGATRGQDETARLATTVNARLDPILGTGNAREFRAHLTVGRVKETARFDWDAALAEVDAPATVSQIDHLTLYLSKTSPKGAAYTALGVTPLRTARRVLSSKFRVQS